MENRSENRYRSEIGLRARNAIHFGIVGTLTFPYQHCFLQITLSTGTYYSRVRHVWATWNMFRRYTCTSSGTILTKQKFMDSAEFSSPWTSSTLVKHARRRRRRRGRCNSCNNLTSKPAVESELQLAVYRARLRAFYRPAIRPYASGARHENVLHCLNARR